MKTKVMANFSSRPLRIKPFLRDLLKEISRNPDLKQNENLADWNSLFDGKVSFSSGLLPPEILEDPEERKTVVPEDSSPMVSEEERSRRKLIASIGRELDRVRTMGNRAVKPFSTGLEKDEESLLEMLSSVVGVSLSQSNSKDAEVTFSNEQHKKRERELTEYYSNPETTARMDELLHKEYLYQGGSIQSPNVTSSLDLKQAGEEQAKILFDESQKESIVQAAKEEASRIFYTHQANDTAKNLFYRAQAEDTAKRLFYRGQAEDAAKHLYYRAEGDKVARNLLNQKNILSDRSVQSSPMNVAPLIDLSKEARRTAENIFYKNQAEDAAKKIFYRIEGEKAARSIMNTGKITPSLSTSEESSISSIKVGDKISTSTTRDSSPIFKESDNLAMAARDTANQIFYQNAGREEAKRLFYKRQADQAAKNLLETLRKSITPSSEVPVSNVERTIPGIALLEWSSRYGQISKSTPPKPIKVNSIQLSAIKNTVRNEQKHSLSLLKQKLMETQFTVNSSETSYGTPRLAASK